MANEYSLNQTTQAEIGEFNNLYAFYLEVSDQVVFNSDITVKGTALVSRLFVENNALVSGRIKTQEVELGTFVPKSNPQPGEDPEDFVPFDPPKLLSELFTDVANNTSDIATNAQNITNLSGRVTAVETSLGEVRGDIAFNIKPDISNLQTRVTALESNPFGSTDLGDLSTKVGTLQTRADALERKIAALISVYQSVKAIHNMPINLE